ncbi:hypothetical protein GCM10011576_48280 [Micromonospora parathelypteridis]|uniref:Uncharacterized protein n=1 Tax=Micromonospora parathelypteridis TaxID=1839617 RepID=A0A840VTF0_9ACTN|nr:hypothetical protein [Micromonospora parathelypteridis]GGO25570.1 hypothetical protein GCM10011576_48280 [Micromonospora parathelypteridis]
MACSTDGMRARLLFCVALLAAGVMTAGTGLLVALGYVEQPGPFNEAILGALGGAMASAGFHRWRKYRSSGLGAHTGHKTA